jgi:hypothetical protein
MKQGFHYTRRYSGSNLVLAGLLALSTSACHQDLVPTPIPTPTLEGAWEKKYVETDEYQSNGSLKSQSGLVPVTSKETYTFTSAQLTITTLVQSLPYAWTRTNEVLTLTPSSQSFPVPFTQTITELTATSLLLQDKRTSTQGGSTMSLFHFIRQ